MDDFEELLVTKDNRFREDIYSCTECSRKIAFGDNFCRNCGVKFTAEMCLKMRNELKTLGKKNFPSLVIVMMVLLAMISIMSIAMMS
jgi:uncharacterized membrane protein YvbJ